MPVARINNHNMHFETHGQGDPVLLMTGWGTFCHGGERHMPWGLTDRYQVIIFDHRGIGNSDDDLNLDPTTRLYADDASELLDHLGLKNVHLIGLVGIGACIAQEIAINRPDLARSMINTGCWAKMDRFLGDQLELMRSVHRDMGFLAFQRLVTVMSFEPEYYIKNIDRLLGEDGVWGDLNGRYEAHSRLVDACLTHDSLGRLDHIKVPSLIMHAGLDQVTGPRITKVIEQGIPGAQGILLEDSAHVIAGKELKKKFADIVLNFLDAH